MSRTLGLIGTYIGISMLAGFAVIIGAALFGTEDFESSTLFNQLLMIANVLALAFTILIGSGKGKLKRSNFVYNLSTKQAAFTLLLFMAIVVLLTLFEEYLPLPNIVKWENYISNPIFAVSVIGIAAPIVEEILFRGLITKALLESYKPTKAIIISAVIFGVGHINPAQIPGALAIGLIFGWLYYKTGSVVPGIILHMINNILSVLMMINLGMDFKIASGTGAVILAVVSFAVLLFAIEGIKAAFAKSE